MATPQQNPSLELLSRTDLLEPAVIRAAATVGIADHLGDGGATSGQVARAAGTDAEVTAALLEELVRLGLATAEPEQDAAVGPRYALTDAGAPLRSDHPMSVRPLLRNDSMLGIGAVSLVHLDHTVRTGEPAIAAQGRSYWDRVNHDPQHRADLEEQVAQAEAAGGQLQWGADRIVDEYDWSDVTRVVDVGGSVGSVLLALAEAHPHLRGTLLDLGNAAAVARERFSRSAAAARLDVVDGSFFDPLPADGDVYLLSAILADWDDEDAVRILRRCREAVEASGGRVLLAEVAMPMDSPATRLRMRSMMPSPARTVEEQRVLAEKAGLQVTRRGAEGGPRSLLELAPR